MMTDADIKKLEKAFSTKNESRELKSELNELKLDVANLTKEMVASFKIVIDMLGDIKDSLDKNIQETQGHRIILGNIEESFKKSKTRSRRKLN